MGQIRKTARCSDVILAAAESFDCSVIQLKHTVMSPHDDYAGSNDEGSAGGSVLILKQIKVCSTHTEQRGCQSWLYPPISQHYIY